MDGKGLRFVSKKALSIVLSIQSLVYSAGNIMTIPISIIELLMYISMLLLDVYIYIFQLSILHDFQTEPSQEGHKL